MSELTGDVDHDLPILADAVCRAADAYTDCCSEFWEEDARVACSEAYQALETAVLRWKGASVVVWARERRR